MVMTELKLQPMEVQKFCGFVYCTKWKSVEEEKEGKDAEQLKILESNRELLHVIKTQIYIWFLNY